MGKRIIHNIVDSIPFWVFSGISILIGIVSFFTPPPGEINESVLKYISWLFAFAALWTVFVAVIHGIDAKLTHGKTSLQIGDIDKTEPVATSEEIIEE